jgi:predicted kinase
MGLLAEQGLVVNRERSSRLVNYPAPAAGANGRRSSPTIVLIGGYAGAGKTELGRILARLTGWPILDKDSATRVVVEAALSHLGSSPNDRESETYLDIVRPAEYEALRQLMVDQVECGNSAIVTAPFIREMGDPAWCRRVASEAGQLNAQLEIVWMDSDPESMRTYLARRGAGRDAYKLAVWAEYLDGIDLALVPAMPHAVVENSLGSPPLDEQALGLLQRWGVSPLP